MVGVFYIIILFDHIQPIASPPFIRGHSVGLVAEASVLIHQALDGRGFEIASL